MATIAKIVKDVKEPPVANTPNKKDYQALIEAYKKANPVKYELKKAELEKKLAAIN